MVHILVGTSHDLDTVSLKEFVPCLFQRKGMIVFAFAELRGSFAATPVFLHMGKERIVCSGDSLRDVLNSLTA